MDGIARPDTIIGVAGPQVAAVAQADSGDSQFLSNVRPIDNASLATLVDAAQMSSLRPATGTTEQF